MPPAPSIVNLPPHPRRGVVRREHPATQVGRLEEDRAAIQRHLHDVELHLQRPTACVERDDLEPEPAAKRLELDPVGVPLPRDELAAAGIDDSLLEELLAP